MRLSHWFALSAALMLTACDAPPQSIPLAFNLTGPSYRLNVAEITVDQDYRAPRHMPNVDHLSDIPPAQAVRQWVSSKLIAAGQENQLEVNIKDASIIEHDIPKVHTGFSGLFTKDQTEQYDGTLEVEIKIYNGRALPDAHIDVIAHQSHTLREDATIIDRQQMYHDISVELMQSIASQMDDQIRRYFSKYVM